MKDLYDFSKARRGLFTAPHSPEIGELEVEPEDEVNEVDNLVNDTLTNTIETDYEGKPWTERRNECSDLPYGSLPDKPSKNAYSYLQHTLHTRVVRTIDGSDTWYEATTTCGGYVEGKGKDRSIRYAVMNAVNNYYLELEKQEMHQNK